MSPRSNSDRCKSPASTSARMAGARSAVIQSRPAGAMSSSMRACVIMPRSPTSTPCLRANRALLLSICAARVAVIAFEHFDRHRAAVWRTHQAVNDLQLALLAVAIVTEPSEFAAAPLQVARRHVGEHKRALAQMLGGKRLLDRALALAEPVDGGVEFVPIDGAETKNVAET